MIQIDIEMPKDCDECPLCHRAFDGNETRLACYGLGVWCLGDEGRLDNCPLHEVTDSDTISRQAVLDAVDTITKWSLLDCNGCHVGVGMKYRDVKETAKSLPPLPSRPKGHWTNITVSVSGDSTADCNRCGATVHNSFTDAINFCPCCGADMRPLADGR